MSIEIYRVEDSHGRGMYFGCSSDIKSRGLSSAPDPLHPHPSQDSSIRDWYYSRHNRELHFFGFGSMAQLRMWIHNDEIRAELTKQGFVINVYIPTFTSPYRVSDFIIGDTQAIFKKDLFTIVNTIDLDSLT